MLFFASSVVYLIYDNNAFYKLIVITILCYVHFKKKSFETLWDKEKMLVTSFISFSSNVFYPSKSELQFFSNIYCNV